jgi:parvulin-like peptidyl-prolyl isomerase
MKKTLLIAISLAASSTAWAQDPVLARNAWVTVTKSDFDGEIARIPKEQQFGFLASSERIARTIENILVNKTLAAQARSAGLHESPAAKAEIAATVDKVLARRAIEKAESEFKLPDFAKRAEEVYKADRAKYTEKDIIHTMHVLVDTKCRTQDAARARALEARAAIVAGTPFGEVAKKYSDDPSVGRNAGDIGPLTPDAMTPPYAEVVLRMKPGEVSEPVLTNFGYHVIRVESVRKGRALQFAEVRDSLVAELREDWLKRQRKEFLEQIAADPKIQLDLKAIEALKTTVTPTAPQPSRQN